VPAAARTEIAARAEDTVSRQQVNVSWYLGFTRAPAARQCVRIRGETGAAGLRFGLEPAGVCPLGAEPSVGGGCVR
jgi:hypothetical protein